MAVYFIAGKKLRVTHILHCYIIISLLFIIIISCRIEIPSSATRETPASQYNEARLGVPLKSRGTIQLCCTGAVTRALNCDAKRRYPLERLYT